MCFSSSSDMVQTRRKKAASVEGNKESATTTPTPKGRRGRPSKKDSIGAGESAPGTPTVIGEESEEQKNGLCSEEGNEYSLSDENMYALISDDDVKVKKELEEDVVPKMEEMGKEEVDDSVKHEIEEDQQIESTATEKFPSKSEEIEIEKEDDSGHVESEVESEAMELETGNSTPINEELPVEMTENSKIPEVVEEKTCQKEIDDAAERAKIMILQKFSKLDRKEEETPVILPYKAPHVFHPAASCFPKRESPIVPPTTPPMKEKKEEGGGEEEEVNSMGIKPIVLKAGRTPLANNNPLIFDRMFGAAKPNIPPPSVVDPPKLSIAAPPPPPPLNLDNISRIRAQNAAEKISQRVERFREDEDGYRRRDERDRRHRKRFEERTREREIEHQTAIQRARMLAEEYRQEEQEQKNATEKNAKEKSDVEKENVVPPYEHIEECKYLIKVASKKKTESLICQCYMVGNNCSDDSCVNRAMNTECPSRCPTNCKNQRFAKRKYAAVEAFHTGTPKGCGLKALKDIKKGQFIIEYVGEMLDRDDYEKRKQKYADDASHKHHYLCDNGIYTIDATSMGNASRFINHSCDPNAVCSKWAVPKTPGEVSRIGFFAKRFINAGEEITFDYNFDNYGREAQQCFCGSENCKGWIGTLPEEECSEGEEDEKDLVTTMELELDDEEKRLVEIDELKGMEKKTAIDELLDDMVLRNRKYAKRVIRAVTRMEDFEQRVSILEEIFSQDTSLHTQEHYAKEGMTKLMYEWLTAEDNSIESLKLKQKILQVLHGEVFVTCVRDDQALINLVAEMAKEKLVVVSEPSEEKNEEGDSQEQLTIKKDVPTDLDVNIDRLREMAFRLNHHWFNRSVNFRIPKKVRCSEVEDKIKDSEEVRNGRDLKYSNERFENQYYRMNGYSSNYRDGYRKRPSEYFDANQRKRFRRSRSRSRSTSPYWKRRKNEDRISQEPRDSRKSTEKENADNCTPSASSSSSGERTTRSESFAKLSGNGNAPNGCQPTPSSKGAVISQPPLPPPPAGGYCGYDYGAFYNNEPNQRFFFRNPPQANSHFPGPSVRHRSYYLPYDENGAKRNPDAYQYLRDMELNYETFTTEQLNEQLRSLTNEFHIIYKILARRDIVLEQQQQQQQLIPPVMPPFPAPPHAMVIPPIPAQAIPPIQAEWGVEKSPPNAVREPPPKPDRYVWARAKSDSGETYYYNKITKETQWSPPRPEQGELDPNDRTPPDTTQEISVNSTEQDEKSRGTSSLSARVGELFEITAEEAVKAHEASEREFKEKMKTEKNREILLQRLEQSRAREAEQIKRNEQKMREFRSRLDKIIAPIVNKYVRNVKDATAEKIDWLTKLVVKEMYKRESSREGFDYTLSEISEKMVRKYTESLMERKVKGEIWKGYKPL